MSDETAAVPPGGLEMLVEKGLVALYHYDLEMHDHCSITVQNCVVYQRDDRPNAFELFLDEGQRIRAMRVHLDGYAIVSADDYNARVVAEARWRLSPWYRRVWEALHA